MASIVTLTAEQVEYFWSRVDSSGGPGTCWPWCGGVHWKKSRYGRVTFSGKHYFAHRVALSLSGQEVPSNMQVLHAPVICHNKLCCNPSHLRVGTDADNARDRALDGTAVYQRPGHAPSSKLGTAGAALARFLVGQGNTHEVVAEWLTVSRSAVSMLMSGRTWP